jgi:hypothetical protein
MGKLFELTCAFTPFGPRLIRLFDRRGSLSGAAIRELKSHSGWRLFSMKQCMFYRIVWLPNWISKPKRRAKSYLVSCHMLSSFSQQASLSVRPYQTINDLNPFERDQPLLSHFVNSRKERGYLLRHIDYLKSATRRGEAWSVNLSREISAEPARLICKFVWESSSMRTTQRLRSCIPGYDARHSTRNCRRSAVP